MLPNENENREEILRYFAIHFANCAEMLSFSQMVSEAVQLAAKRSSLDGRTSAILVNMILREARKFRSVTVLCERGLVGDAEQLVRSLFDGALAARFVCQEPVSAPQRPAGIRDPQFPPIPTGMHAVDFRAHVYAGHQLLQKHLAAENAEVQSIVPKETIDSIAAHAKQLMSDIGEEWSRRIGKSQGYSGLGIKDLAGNYGLLSLYSSYKEHSNRTHANDAFACVSFTQDGSVNVYWCGKDEGQIPVILKMAAAYLADTCRSVLSAVGEDLLADEAYVLAKAINDCE